MKKIAYLSEAMRGRITIATQPRTHIKVKIGENQSEIALLKRTFFLLSNNLYVP